MYSCIYIVAYTQTNTPPLVESIVYVSQCLCEFISVVIGPTHTRKRSCISFQRATRQKKKQCFALQPTSATVLRAQWKAAA